MSQSDPSEEEEQHIRASYRVRYPVSYPENLLPKLALPNGAKATIEDFSETGLRIDVPKGMSTRPGDKLGATITFADSSPVVVTGTVVWVRETAFALRLDPPGLSFKLIMSEQRALLAWQQTRAEKAIIRDDKGPHSR
jgi:hypothetical protein